MMTKTKLLFGNLLLLAYWLFAWVMMFFNIWDWGVFVLGQLIIFLPLFTVFRVKVNQFGKFRIFILFLTLSLWFVTIQIARSHGIDTDNFPALPSWLKLLYLVVFLTVAVVFVSKMYRNSKFSETQAEGD